MNRIVTVLAGFTVSFLLTACETVSPAFGPGTTNDQIVHRTSGFSFPSRVGLFQRERAIQYDAAGQNVSVGYNAGALIAATFYVYPAGGRSLDSEFAIRRDEILASHPGATETGQRNVTVTPRGVSARSATFAFAGIFAHTQQQLASQLVLTRHGDQFVKYRFTYPASSSDRAAAEVSQFLRTFSWP